MNKFCSIKKISFVVACVFFCLFFQSCRPMVSLQRPEDYIKLNTLSFPDDFESFWNGMNNNYLFWDIDPTDWDAIYREYKPKFAALGVFDGTDEAAYTQAKQKAYQYYKEMTENLIDGHYRLSFMDGSFSAIMPAYARVKKRMVDFLGDAEFKLMGSTWSSNDPTDLTKLNDYDFMTNVIFRYFDPGTAKKEIVYFGPNQTGTRFNLGTGRIAASGDEILYFYFDSFSLAGALDLSTLIKEVIDALKTEDLKGVIIDVRWNGGGASEDLGFLWGRMTDKDLTPGYTRTKSGEGRLDHTPWFPFTIKAAPEGERMKNVNVPVVLLANKLSLSCSELSAMTVKLMDNGTFIGEQTFGGTSPLWDNRIYNGGIFNGGIFYKQAYTPLAETKCWDGNSYEGKGVPPDKDVPLDWGRFLHADPTKRGDSQLEAAIKHIDPSHTF